MRWSSENFAQTPVESQDSLRKTEQEQSRVIPPKGGFRTKEKKADRPAVVFSEIIFQNSLGSSQSCEEKKLEKRPVVKKMEVGSRQSGIKPSHGPVVSFEGEDMPELDLQAPFPLDDVVQDTSPSPITVRDFIRRFSARPWTAGGLSGLTNGTYAIPGLQYCLREHAEDLRLLSGILDRYNATFPLVYPYQEIVLGEVKRLDLSSDDLLYVQADLHGDVTTLISVLTLLKNGGYLDSSYVCQKNFFLVFLGDFTDRGLNDGEVLILLLLLQIENPQNLFLIRGNHESNVMRKFFLAEAAHFDLLYPEDFLWFQENRLKLEACYARMPLAICAGEIHGENGRREFVHFSHGALPVTMDLTPLFQDKVRSLPIMSDPSLHVVSQTVSPMVPGPKQEKAVQKVFELAVMIEPFHGIMHQWGELGEKTEFLKKRSIGYSLCADDLHAIFRAMRSPLGTIKVKISGHVHEKRELTVVRKSQEDRLAPSAIPIPRKDFWTKKIPLSPVKQKVIGITLPAGALGAFRRDPQRGLEMLIGLLLTVAPRTRSWGKKGVFYNVETPLVIGRPVAFEAMSYLQQRSVFLYDSLGNA